MPVPTTLRGISLTAASNSPAGTDVIGSSLDDYLRSIQTVFRQYLAAPATNIASASTTDLSTADGFYVAITGTTTITSFGTEQAGIHYLLKFTGALTLTHNATSLILPTGANIATSAGDMAWVISEGSGNWRCLFYVPVAGTTATTFTFNGSGGSTGSLTLSYQKTGQWVTLNIPPCLATTGTGSTSLVSNTAIPAPFRPAASQRAVAVNVNNNGVDVATPGVWLIGTSGILVLSRDATSAAFTNSATGGASVAQSITYFVG